MADKEMTLLQAMQKHGLEVRAGSEIADVLGWLHTGNFALNWAVSGRLLRGWPLGRTVEIFGDNSTGKSYLIYRAIAQAQQEGGLGFLDDTEAALIVQWAANKLGIDPKTLAYADPRSRTVQEHLKKMQSYVAAFRKLKIDKPSVAALDSLGHLTTEYEVEKGAKDLKRAQEIHMLHRVIGGEIADIPVLYILANHKIASFGGMFSKDESSGGQATKYASSVRINLYAPTKLKNPKTGDYNGVIVNAYVEKNRLVRPWRKVKMAIPWDRPIDETSGLIDMLLERKVLDTTSSHTLVYQEKDTEIKAHKSNFLKQDRAARELLDAYPDLLIELDQQFEEEENTIGTGEMEEEE